MPILAREPVSESSLSLQRWLQEGTAAVERQDDVRTLIFGGTGLGTPEYYAAVSDYAPLERALFRVADEFQQNGGMQLSSRFARTGLQFLQAKHLVPRKVVRSNEGGVAFIFKKADKRAEVEYLPDESVVLVMFSMAGPIDVLEFTNVASFGEAGVLALARYLET